MPLSSNVRKPRGRPPIGATPLTVRVLPDQLARLDKWIANQPDAAELTRPEAIRRLMEVGLKAEKKPI
jgi:hypothetical protein